MGGKRFKKSKQKKFKLKYIIIFLIICSLIIISYYIYTNKDNIFNKNSENQMRTTKIVEIKTVENASYLEISDLEIVPKDGYSTVQTTIKNTSNETLTNFRLDICIYDENNNLISQLANPIDSLSPNESVNSFGIVYKELLDAYTCIIKKN